MTTIVSESDSDAMLPLRWRCMIICRFSVLGDRLSNNSAIGDKNGQSESRESDQVVLVPGSLRRVQAGAAVDLRRRPVPRSVSERTLRAALTSIVTRCWAQYSQRDKLDVARGETEVYCGRD